MTAVGRDRMRIIGVLEVLGAIGLILPALTGILPWLVPTAAAALAVLMVLAAVFHLGGRARSKHCAELGSRVTGAGRGHREVRDRSVLDEAVGAGRRRIVGNPVTPHLPGSPSMRLTSR